MKNHKYLQDRGTKKWTTMMLPEHKEQLKDMWRHEDDQPRPYFDEQQLEEFNRIIFRAYQEKQLVSITYCSADVYCEQNVRETTGNITEIHAQLQMIGIDDTKIYINDLLDIQLVE